MKERKNKVKFVKILFSYNKIQFHGRNKFNEFFIILHKYKRNTVKLTHSPIKLKRKYLDMGLCICSHTLRFSY